MQMQFSTSQLAGSYYNSTSKVILRKNFNIANVLGYPENIDEDLSSLYSTNPVQVAFLHLLGEPTAGSAMNATWTVDATFYTRFYDLKTLSDSLAISKSEDTYILVKKA